MLLVMWLETIAVRGLEAKEIAFGVLALALALANHHLFETIGNSTRCTIQFRTVVLGGPQSTLSQINTEL